MNAVSFSDTSSGKTDVAAQLIEKKTKDKIFAMSRGLRLDYSAKIFGWFYFSSSIRELTLLNHNHNNSICRRHRTSTHPKCILKKQINLYSMIIFYNIMSTQQKSKKTSKISVFSISVSQLLCLFTSVQCVKQLKKKNLPLIDLLIILKMKHLNLDSVIGNTH